MVLPALAHLCLLVRLDVHNLHGGDLHFQHLRAICQLLVDILELHDLGLQGHRVIGTGLAHGRWSLEHYCLGLGR